MSGTHPATLSRLPQDWTYLRAWHPSGHPVKVAPGLDLPARLAPIWPPCRGCPRTGSTCASGTHPATLSRLSHNDLPARLAPGHSVEAGLDVHGAGHDGAQSDVVVADHLFEQHLEDVRREAVRGAVAHLYRDGQTAPVVIELAPGPDVCREETELVKYQRMEKKMEVTEWSRFDFLKYFKVHDSFDYTV